MVKKYAQPTVEVDPQQLFQEEYNLGEIDFSVIPKEELNRLREDWIDARRLGHPLYVVDGAGKIWYVAVDGTGQALTLHPVVPRYEIQEGYTRYEGPDAWYTLEEALGRYDIIPMTPGLSESNVEAHRATVASPVWFRAVQYIISRHYKGTENPYK